MGQLTPLFSGSSGNCSYIGAGDRGFLVDAGGSCKSIRNALEAVGTSLDRVEAIFITHEHSDHIKGLRVLLKAAPIPVYTSAGTLKKLIDGNHIPENVETIVIDEEPFEVMDVGVQAFHTPHDAAEPMGFVFQIGETKVGYATDLGEITPQIKEYLLGCQSLLLESNYDEAMLKRSSYPVVLKRRIAGENGHLSNTDCASFVMDLIENGTTHFMLGHLSQENNLPDIAFQTTQRCLLDAQMVQNKDYILRIASRYQPSKGLYF